MNIEKISGYRRMDMIWKNRYVKWGLTVFCTVGALLLFYDTVFSSHALIDFVKKLFKAAQPVLYGAFMAYLLAPVVNFFEVRPFAPPSGSCRMQETGSGKHKKGIRAVSILLTWALILVMVYVLFSILIPELYKSLQQLLSNIETYYQTISGWIQHLLETNPALERWAAQQMDTYYQLMENWVKNELLPHATTLMGMLSGGVFSGVYSVVSFFSDLLVGIIVSVYFLATKESCAAHARKVAYSVFSERQVGWVLRGTAKVDRIFSGFVRGKLLDSLIIGVLCFLGCTALKMPYTPLVSVIVGATNVIPFFGPFLGAIPSTFLILLVSPMKAVYFVIFVLALQQLDGNVIGPKILGDKTGLSSLWVIIAILIGGSFFGLAGMFFGVPVCACLYSLVTFLVELRLKEKGLPLETAAYSSGQKQPAPPAETPPSSGK
jgi:predicted PurR-regulated permease PerM